jgi:ribosomal subunit interface protein
LPVPVATGQHEEGKEHYMQLNVSGHHVEVTPPLREYVESKFERLQRHFDQITNTEVTLIVEKLIQKAEASVHISGADIFAAAESEDMYAAIDALADKLDRQLIKHKEKLRGR